MLVDLLDRHIRARYEEVTPSEGEIWFVTLTHPNACTDARNVPALRAPLGWLTETIWYDGPIDGGATECHWNDEHVYPHRNLNPKENA